MIREDWVFALATDAHNLEHRPPELAAGRAAVENLIDAGVAHALTYGNPARLLGLEIAASTTLLGKASTAQ
jgi:protein-tyrosine phosphatase